MSSLNCLAILVFMSISSLLVLAQFDPVSNPFVQFMTQLRPGQRRQFFKLTTNPNVTKAQMEEQIVAFGQENGLTEQLCQMNSTVAKIMAQMKEAAPQNLAGPALDTYNRVTEILSDMNQPRGEQCDQVRSALNATDPTVRLFLPKGLGICCLGVGNDPMAAKLKAAAGTFGRIGQQFFSTGGQGSESDESKSGEN